MDDARGDFRGASTVHESWSRTRWPTGERFCCKTSVGGRCVSCSCSIVIFSPTFFSHPCSPCKKHQVFDCVQGVSSPEQGLCHWTSSLSQFGFYTLCCACRKVWFSSAGSLSWEHLVSQTLIASSAACSSFSGNCSLGQPHPEEDQGPCLFISCVIRYLPILSSLCQVLYKKGTKDGLGPKVQVIHCKQQVMG